MATFSYLFILAIFIIHSSSICIVQCTGNINTDVSVLLSLKAQLTLHDPNNILATNWSTATSICHWVGVHCDSQHHRVVALDISNMGLLGKFPTTLGNLSFLSFLNMSNNNFVGEIPQQLGNLRNLKVIDTHRNHLTGAIPNSLFNISAVEHIDFSNNSLSGILSPNICHKLPNLKMLYLYLNGFNGPLPANLSACSKLGVLSLTSNMFDGLIPKELGKLEMLEKLLIGDNNLTGTIPNELGNLHNLKKFVIDGNEIIGYIPTFISNMSSLQILALSTNKLMGCIPREIGNLSSLRWLFLQENHFKGMIPREIGNLSSLQWLFIQENHFTGTIPNELGNLHNLKKFVIEGNEIIGYIPTFISNMSSLQILALSTNKLMGCIPREIGNLSSLRWLFLQENHFKGMIPREIGNLSSLQRLILQENHFTGMIPREVSYLSKLEIIGCDNNNLSGTLPEGLFNITTLRIISLANNHLLGSIPSTMCSPQTKLEELSLAKNVLSGVIPHSIANCSQLSIISLSVNHFSGSIPNSLENLSLLRFLGMGENKLASDPSSQELSFITSLTKCRKLKTLYVGGNILRATLPRSIGNLSSTLQIFSADSSGLYGTIPDEIGNLTGLEDIVISANKLSGTIPNTLQRLHGLARLYLAENKLSGPLTGNLCKVQNLGEIYLSKNGLSGPIPECLGNVTSLRYIHLDSNRMNGIIPSNLWNLKNLLTLNLSFNSISGALPSEIENLDVLYILDLSNNNLSGIIPSTIGSLQNLINLSLAQNQMHGQIPESIDGMLSLESLDLSRNNLSGSIPVSLQTVRYLHHLNVSFNSLSGEIPSNGPFKNFTSLSFLSNEALCGDARFGVPPCHKSVVQRSKAKRILRYILMALGITSLILAFAVGVVLITFWRKKKHTKNEELLRVKEVGRVSYYTLLHATDGYNERNVIGAGSFGTVYRGILEDGTILAIKVFNVQMEGAFESFIVECKIMFDIRHRNLVKLLGYCSNPNFKALVLEYMPKGNLDDWLYAQDHFLDITQRLNIMIDVAYALEYLHYGYPKPVVHCDLKPSNILFDEDMVAHVGDFGIAKLLGSDDSIAYTKTLATLGYIAPEYGSGGIVSTKCDVYSYGILLMETFTRTNPSNEIFSENLSLKIWVKDSMPNKVIDIIDANLFAPDEEPSSEKIKCLSCIMELALRCCLESPAERICMKEVVSALQKIKRQLSCCI